MVPRSADGRTLPLRRGEERAVEDDGTDDRKESVGPTAAMASRHARAIHGAAQERDIGQQGKAAGGKWNPKEGVWELPDGQGVSWRTDGANRLQGQRRQVRQPSTNRWVWT
jgi:hypothetical protein